MIEGLHFTFVELPKFKPHSISDKRMMVLWLRFLTEINSNTTEVPAELQSDPEISKALEEVKITAFTEAELRAYDRFWDSVRVEKTLQADSFEDGMDKGRAEGISEEKIANAKRFLAMGLSPEQVAEGTQLPLEEIKKLQ